MKNITVIAIYILIGLSFTSMQTKNENSIKIGSQTWSTKNLDIDHFRNGDKIKQVKSDMEWLMADANKEPAWCYFEFNEANNTKYGKLYNGHAVLDKRGLAPKDWKIPTDTDFKTLEAHIGKNGNKLKADNSNNVGFSALYSGSINQNGAFMPEYFMVWTSTTSGNGAFYRRLNNYNSTIDRKISRLGSGYAVRLIR